MKITAKQRDIKITEWNSKGLTQIEIADKLGITRQRVQQIEKRLGLVRERKTVETHTLTCKQCGKKFKSNKLNRNYCSRGCFYESRLLKLTPKEAKLRIEKKQARNREKATWYYHNVFKKRPDWQKIVQERNQKYAARTTN